MEQEKDMMKIHVECDNLGNMTEYIRCKITTNRAIKIAQLVLFQSLKDKFDLPHGVPPTTPVKPGTSLTKQLEEEPLNTRCWQSTTFGAKLETRYWKCSLGTITAIIGTTNENSQ